jgi:hypothetical protein
MGSILKIALGFVPGIGPLLSGGLGMVTSLFTGKSTASGGSPWKWIAILAGVAVTGVGTWKTVGFVRTYEANEVALAAVTGQRDQAIAAASANAKSLADAEAQHAAVLASANAAADAAKSRALSLAQTLEKLHAAPRSVCVPSAAARSLLDGLRR